MLGMPNRVAADAVKSESPPTMGAMLRRILMLERVIKATEGTAENAAEREMLAPVTRQPELLDWHAEHAGVTAPQERTRCHFDYAQLFVCRRAGGRGCRRTIPTCHLHVAHRSRQMASTGNAAPNSDTQPPHVGNQHRFARRQGHPGWLSRDRREPVRPRARLCVGSKWSVSMNGRHACGSSTADVSDQVVQALQQCRNILFVTLVIGPWTDALGSDQFGTLQDR